MSRVPVTDIFDMQAEDYSVSVQRRLGGVRGGATTSAAGSNSVSLQATTLTGIKVFYTVKTTSVYSAKQLYTELTRAISSGAFNQNLYTNAQSIGAVSMYGVTSDNIQQTHTTKPPLSNAEIGGIVAGCVVCVIVLIGGCLFYCTSKRKLECT